ncbi:MAG: branched chain amino acid aminotransferase [Candidatus Kapaibacterium sp.]|nr:MAG: branched chain amino acid aminotransferase [Candidatus Kapabacteria bacterium]GIV55318.1 MAG: branched chain amino acid aminotransferase [Candidatus Kapabacteria bacterium]
MPIPKTRTIWMNGRFVPWEKAHVHVLSHALHYASSWFEGIRAYATKRGIAVFRLQDHLRRLQDSCKMYAVELPYTLEELERATLELLRRNRLGACYIRPLVFRGYGEMGVLPLNCPVEVVIAAWQWGRYLGEDSAERGVDICVSSWTRPSNNALPAMAKAAANYLNSQLVKIEAARHGYAEGLTLDEHGNLSEGSGENVFLVRDGTLYTPPLAASILPGITRATVVELARDEGIPVVEQIIPRAMLYVADEVFLTGTAAEITPVRSIDRIAIGSGTVGPVTRAIMERFARITRDGEDPYQWLTFVNKSSARASKRTRSSQTVNSK